MYAPRLRFNEFTDTWTQNTINEISVMFSGGTPKSTNRKFYSGEIPFIRSGEIHSERTELFINEEALKSSSAKMVQKGDILYALYGATSGEVGISKIEGAINQAILCIKPSCDVYFLKTFLESQKKSIINRFLQGGQGNLSASIIKEISIHIPSINEQVRISNFFKVLDKKIQLQQEKMDLLKEQKKGYMQKIFTQELRFKDDNHQFFIDWKEVELGNISVTFSGGTPSVSNKSYYNGTIPFIRSGEIHTDKTELYISETAIKSSSAKMVEKGDILYALYGATSGEVAISQIDGAINQAILCIRTNENKFFLKYWLENMKENILNVYLQGGQGNLSASIIKSLKINLPHIDEQTIIAEFFVKIDKKIQREKIKLNFLMQQKQAFMQQMFI